MRGLSCEQKTFSRLALCVSQTFLYYPHLIVKLVSFYLAQDDSSPAYPMVRSWPSCHVVVTLLNILTPCMTCHWIITEEFPFSVKSYASCSLEHGTPLSVCLSPSLCLSLSVCLPLSITLTPLPRTLHMFTAYKLVSFWFVSFLFQDSLSSSIHNISVACKDLWMLGADFSEITCLDASTATHTDVFEY